MSKILIIGLGLISGSLLKLFKQTDPDLLIDVVARRPQTLALAKGLIRQGYLSLRELPDFDYDLIIFGVPMQATIEMCALLQGRLDLQTIVTDICSVKKSIEEQVALKDNFVGGHPLAGSEKAGFEYADAQILKGAKYILTTDGNPDKRSILKNFLEKMGFNVLEMSATEHDNKLAAVSHLPYMVAVSLIGILETEQLSLAAGGLASTTRVAASPTLWGQEIARYNKKYLLSWLDKYLARLQLIRQNIAEDKNFSKILESARTKRAEL